MVCGLHLIGSQIPLICFVWVFFFSFFFFFFIIVAQYIYNKSNAMVIYISPCGFTDCSVDYWTLIVWLCVWDLQQLCDLEQCAFLKTITCYSDETCEMCSDMDASWSSLWQHIPSSTFKRVQILNSASHSFLFETRVSILPWCVCVCVCGVRGWWLSITSATSANSY